MPAIARNPFLVHFSKEASGTGFRLRPMWAVIEVDFQEGGYYVGVQEVDPEGQPLCRMHSERITTPKFAVIVSGDPVVIFASRTLEDLRPLTLRQVDKAKLRTTFNPAEVTKVTLDD